MMCQKQRLPRILEKNDFFIKYYAIKHHSSEKYFKFFKKCCYEYENISKSILRIQDIPKDFKINKFSNFSEYLKEPEFNKGKRIN